jgi:hypothetical protein
VTTVINTSGYHWQATNAAPSRRNPRSQSDLAWALAATIRGSLTRMDSVHMYAALGAGNTFETIVALLHVAIDRNIVIDDDLCEDLDVWLAGYAHTPEEAELHQLTKALRAAKAQHEKRMRRRTAPYTPAARVGHIATPT